MNITVQHVINELCRCVEPLEHTVDILHSGDPDAEVSGIATTFTASQQVIEQALALGVNMLITHEGPYYSHHPSDKLQEDPVVAEKKRLIEQSGIAIFRLHDYVHLYEPDGMMMGLLHALGWENYVVKHERTYSILDLPARFARDIASFMKKKLDIGYVRIAGEVDQICKRVGICVGYRGGGEHAIPLFHQEQLDLIIAGEGPEWETPEYVRDAVQQGRAAAMIMLGHAESESPGMRRLAEQLSRSFPTIPVHYIQDQPIFQIL